MIIRIKLYAALGKYLPEGAVKNEADMEVAKGTTPEVAFTSLNVPLEQCHLVLINGLFVPPPERATRTLADGDHLAAWPPVAGGGGDGRPRDCY